MKEAQRRIDNELSKAEKKFNRVYKQVLKEQAVALKEMQDKQRRAMQSMNDTANKLGGVLAGVFIGLAVAIPTATYAMLKLNSELNAMIARIGVFTGNVAGARDTLKELVGISLDTGVALGAVEDVFGKISMNAKALDADGQSVIEVTRGVAQAIAISGKPISEMAGALTQLGQAFASPIVQAEEFRSVFEGANFFANEIAKSILGPNGTAGALFQLVKKQKLTNKMLFIAIKDALPRILKQFGQMPLSLDRVINRFQLMGFRVAMAMDEFQKLEGPQKFLRVLDNLIEKTTNYLINNQDLISSKMSEFFDNAKIALDNLVKAYKTFEPVLLWTIKNIDTLTAGLEALLAGYVALKVFMLVQMIPTAYATGVAMTAALGPVGIALVGLIALVTFLELKFKLLSNTWNNVLGEVIDPVNFKKGKEAMSKIRASNAPNPLSGGYAAYYARKQTEAQRQASGGNINNSQKSLSNSFYFSNTPSTAQAKSIGNNLVSSSNRAFYALN
jgi:tape measure domain-containing protein